MLLTSLLGIFELITIRKEKGVFPPSVEIAPSVETHIRITSYLATVTFVVVLGVGIWVHLKIITQGNKFEE